MNPSDPHDRDERNSRAGERIKTLARQMSKALRAANIQGPGHSQLLDCIARASGYVSWPSFSANPNRKNPPISYWDTQGLEELDRNLTERFAIPSVTALIEQVFAGVELSYPTYDVEGYDGDIVCDLESRLASASSNVVVELQWGRVTFEVHFSDWYGESERRQGYQADGTAAFWDRVVRLGRATGLIAEQLRDPFCVALDSVQDERPERHPRDPARMAHPVLTKFKNQLLLRAYTQCTEVDESGQA